MSGLIAELRRRSVFRVAAAYVVAGWIVMQVVEVMGPALRLPDWTDSFFALLVIIGFPIALLLAWAFELTPEGIRRTAPADGHGRKPFAVTDMALIGALAIVIGLGIYQTVGGTRDAAHQAGVAVPGLERHAAIAVLPFRNVSDNPEQDYFVDGLTVDIINSLQRLRLFPVIAHNSTFGYKGEPVDVKTVGRELGARYVVEGTVRRSGESLRVTAQLLDARTAYSIWSGTYDRQLSDLFELQDDITRSIAAGVVPEIKRSEIERATAKPTEDLDAYDLYLRGLRLTRDDDIETVMRARANLIASTDLDPGFAPAWVQLAWIEHDLIASFSYTMDLERVALARDNAFDFARKAVSADPRLADAHLIYGHMLLHFAKSKQGLTEIEEAVTLNPASSFVQSQYAWALLVNNRLEEALERLALADRLNPNHPQRWEIVNNKAYVYYFSGDYDEAIAHASDALRINPDQFFMYMVIASANNRLGNRDAARAAIVEAREMAPGFQLESLQYTSFPPKFIEQFVTDLRELGWGEQS